MSLVDAIAQYCPAAAPYVIAAGFVLLGVYQISQGDMVAGPAHVAAGIAFYKTHHVASNPPGK